MVVLGGGPAGCAAARLLAQWGHAVTLVTRPGPPAAGLGESLPPSTEKLFDLLGIRDAIAGAGFIRSTGNTVAWGHDGLRVEPFAGGARGWQVTAHQLEPILQRAAREAGVGFEQRRASEAESRGDAGTFTLDCTGRAGLVARARGWRVAEPAHRTVALIGHWRSAAGFDIPDQTQTVIESYGNGWAWSVPRAPGTDAAAAAMAAENTASPWDRYIAVMVDPTRSDLLHDRTARDVYLAEIGKTRLLAALSRRAALVHGPTGWDASMYSARRYAAERTLLVGDAGSFIDPLSSIGVKKALASGWLAAVATHTALVRPAMRTTALEFFAAREADVYAAFRRLTAQYLAGAAPAHAHPFWDDRTPADFLDSAPDDAAEVRAAFERVRRAELLRLRPAADLRVEPRPAVAGSEIVLESRLVSNARPAGVRFLCDVDLIALTTLAPSCTQVPDLFEAYNRSHAPAALPDFLTALATAIARGYLRFTSETTAG